MIRVGFVINPGSEWLGGLHYYKTLLASVQSLPDRRIVPVLITGLKNRASIAEKFPDFDVISTSLLDRGSFAWLIRKILAKGINRDFIFDRFLARTGIEALSHSESLGIGARTPTIGWIPDFQHRRMPEFFSVEERAERDRGFSKLLRQCARVIVSSESARKDLVEFFPDFVQKARVLRFVVEPPPLDRILSRKELESHYEFSSPYLYLPNQFWAHKNHEIVIRALSRLKKSGKEALVLATGNPSDYRQPAHFSKLAELARDLGVAENFKILGLVPYTHVGSLIHHSVALINPSFFEGWSTTVEEAKSFGKRILLSDIPVHREQAPALGEFFDPRDVRDCAEQIAKVMDMGPSDGSLMENARSALRSRQTAFAETYQGIILEAIGMSSFRVPS